MGNPCKQCRYSAQGYCYKREYCKAVPERKQALTFQLSLQPDSWSDLTVEEIAEVMGVPPQAIYNAFGTLRKKGVNIPHKRKKRGRKPEI